jgi:H+/gluconate symporter-like permease
MLLILEIALTIAAWKNGWGARALLPLAGAFLVAFLGGVAIGASGGSVADGRVLGFLCDLGAVIVLGVMSRKSPSSEETSLSLTSSDEPSRLTGRATVSGD